ncbi:hypothetical protein [Algoriphagus boritolerans]|uniref:alpha/beta hydrolase family protein n=1 Tax=Algoriphagus boritolerans TaxID=308111 RepID=UPI002FCE0738
MGLTKAKESNRILVRRSTYRENPDVYLTDLTFKNLTKASNLNPQQAGINWGSVELISYLANDGTPLQGLLFKPEGFDSSKKYPMMVYFYERNSDTYHNYRAPAPSRSTINIPFFVSNDYLVFVPDIKYDLGLPGPSAYNCIIPGVQAVIAREEWIPKIWRSKAKVGEGIRLLTSSPKRICLKPQVPVRR